MDEQACPACGEEGPHQRDRNDPDIQQCSECGTYFAFDDGTTLIVDGHERYEVVEEVAFNEGQPQDPNVPSDQAGQPG